MVRSTSLGEIRMRHAPGAALTRPGVPGRREARPNEPAALPTWIRIPGEFSARIWQRGEMPQDQAVPLPRFAASCPRRHAKPLVCEQGLNQEPLASLLGKCRLQPFLQKRIYVGGKSLNDPSNFLARGAKRRAARDWRQEWDVLKIEQDEAPMRPHPKLAPVFWRG